MDIKEIEKRLYDFATFLDNKQNFLNKAKLSSFFTGYLQLYIKFYALSNKVYYLEKELELLKKN